ncbi:MAG: DUF790 family protein [Victivallales bacterium]|nr:DUF790 family protein [Victivallales bacterium]
MLNRSLISAICRQGVVYPTFVKTMLPGPLELATQLIDAYRTAAAQHQTAAELEEYTTPLIDGASNRRLALALRKLLDERSTFSSLAEIDFPKLRAEVLEHSAKLLQGNEALPEVGNWRELLQQKIPDNPLLQEGQLYADLPENDCLLEFKDLNAQQLLNRYNLALVQGILLTARHLDIHLATADAPRLRRVFKYLRFFQLLATVETEAETPDDSLLRMHLIVDGPASILDQSKRYGLQLAAFLPAICSVERWSLEAEVTWKTHENAMLRLTQDSRLECPYHNFAAYVPDEIRLFHQHFQEAVPEWRIVGNTPFLRGEGREIIFPDLSFQYQDGTLVHLELFNRWHANGLAERVKWLETHPEIPLVLGVDRTVASKPDMQAILEASEWFAQYGFLYRDYPTCDRTRKALQKRLEVRDER